MRLTIGFGSRHWPLGLALASALAASQAHAQFDYPPGPSQPAARVPAHAHDPYAPRAQPSPVGTYSQRFHAPGAYPAPSAPPTARPTRTRRWSRLLGTDRVRRVQATPEDMQGIPGVPGGLPGAAPNVPPPTVGEGASVSNTSDLFAPAAERAFGGGEPTEELAEAEAAGETAEDSRGLLMKALDFDPDSQIKVYGWIQNSFTGNPSQPSDGVNFGVNPNYKANQWMGNQYYLIVENPVEQTDQVNFGFRVDNLFGNDWQFNKMYGLYDRAFNPGQFAGYDTAQMYVEMHLPVLTRGGIDIKGGRFYTLAGYEVVPAVGRPLLSVPYMFNYGQPFTHFGMASTWHVTDQLNIYNCAINGWDRWIDQNYKWGYMGGFSWSSKATIGDAPRFNWTTILVWGPNQFPNYLAANTPIVPTGATPPPFLAGRRNLGYGSNNRTLFTTVLSYKWTEKLTQVMETDEAIENNLPGLGTGGTNNNAEWYSFGNWFLYDFFGDGKLTGVWRSEIFRDNNGARTGFATNFSEITLGLIAKPVDYIWIRPEARYDWARSGHPYNGGNSNSQFTIGFDVIFLF